MTKLTYMEEMFCYRDTAQIKDIKTEGDFSILFLDKTIFYPQGGGQPYDTGRIIKDAAEFTVEEVRYNNGNVRHVGQIESGNFATGDEVTLIIDQKRRELNAKIHTAGHLIDSAMDKIGLSDLVATKGFHFPQGSYVLYKGEIPIEERGRVAQDLNQELAAMIKQGFEIEYRLVSIDELADLIEEVPNYLPKNKPIRVVKVWEDKWIPCGGVHTNSLKNLREIEVTKIKTKKGDIKVSYKII